MPFPSLTGLSTRLRRRVDSAARGTDIPAGIERGADAASNAGSRERGRMRRRLRELRRLREAQLLELGALVLEAHRHGRDDSPVIKSKAAEAAQTDSEARALADALQTGAGLDTLVAAGIAGPCPTCGALASTAARFCSACGTALDGRPDASAAADAPQAHAATVDAATADPVASDPGPVDPAAAEAVPAPAEPGDRTTELPAANGNGASPEELEAARGSGA